MKDHRIAQIVNDLRAIATEHKHEQSLRCRISAYLTPILRATQEKKESEWCQTCLTIHISEMNRMVQKSDEIAKALREAIKVADWQPNVWKKALKDYEDAQ